MSDRIMNIGVLALQGAFAEHLQALSAIPGVRGREIRKRSDFHPDLSGLIIPGGESTVMAKLLADLALLHPVAEAIRDGLPVFGTCAGLILLARGVGEDAPPRIGQMDVAVRRNAYGRQLESFAARADFAGRGEIPLVFIRAPALTRIGGDVRVLAEVEGRPVAVRQKNMLATAFHPELTGDPSVHAYFADMIAGRI